MAVDMPGLVADLAAESADLEAMLAPLGDADWQRPTPAAGWCIADQVSHLAFFDDAALTAALDPDRFVRETSELAADGIDFPDRVAARYRNTPGNELMAWFRSSRAALLAAFDSMDPGARLPWYGPPMSAASSATARLMETWAHGQDVADALGRTRTPTDRLRHIAHLGFRTIGYAFAVNGLDAPTEPIRVEVVGPHSDGWAWGPAEAANVVRGPAIDFCLVVTQRRHMSDTSLTTTGDVAARWLSIAQAFAGPPGLGRPPLDVQPRSTHGSADGPR
jgi:uncharacterized protein (TIGR03084 family)